MGETIAAGLPDYAELHCRSNFPFSRVLAP